MVTAVITTYKRPLDVLMRAINSVLDQTYPDIEVIVVNDAPEEKLLSEKIENAVLAIDHKNIRYICHEKNKGACAARNTGLSAAHGEYIGFLDDDDEWLPEKVEKQVQVFSENPDAALVYCAFLMQQNNNCSVYNPDLAGKSAKERIILDNFIGSTSFPLLKTSLVRMVGGFDEELTRCQDYDMWIKLIKRYPISKTDLVLGKYYVSDDSTFRNNHKKYFESMELLNKKHDDLYREYKRTSSDSSIMHAKYFFREKELYYALKLKIRAWKQDPLNPNNLIIVQLAKYIRRHLR